MMETGMEDVMIGENGEVNGRWTRDDSLHSFDESLGGEVQVS